jgi:hypothetical protein
MSGDEEDIWWEAQDQMEELKKGSKTHASEFEKEPMSGMGKWTKGYYKAPEILTYADVALEGAVGLKEMVDSWISRVPSNTPFFTEGILIMQQLMARHAVDQTYIKELNDTCDKLNKEHKDQKVFLDSLAQAEKEGRLSWTGVYFATSPVRLLAEGRVVTLDD